MPLSTLKQSCHCGWTTAGEAVAPLRGCEKLTEQLLHLLYRTLSFPPSRICNVSISGFVVFNTQVHNRVLNRKTPHSENKGDRNNEHRNNNQEEIIAHQPP